MNPKNTLDNNSVENTDSDLQEALDYLNVDKEDVEKKSKVSIKGFNGMSEKILEVNKITLEYKMTLEGKEFDSDENQYIQVSKAIAGSHFIRLSSGIINSFSETANLVSKKDIDKFNIQFIDAFLKLNNAALRDRTIGEKDMRLVLKLAKDKLCNVGDIITNNEGNMAAVIGKYEDDEEKKKLGEA